MSDSKNKIGNCAICGNYTTLTYEHIPPQKALNNYPVFRKNDDNLFGNGPYYGKQMRSNRGMGGYTLCESCNKITGTWYAKDYINWSQQGIKILSANRDTHFLNCDFEINPLNVLKQIFSFFLSIDKSGIIRSNKEIVEFVLEKENQFLPEKHKIFMYLNFSRIHRFMGYCQIGSIGEKQIYKWSEINFFPFGFLYCEDSPPANEFQYDITFFKNSLFNQQKIIKIPLFYLEVNSPIIGTYYNH